MAARFVPPAVDRKSFNCPHCGALADQEWFKIHLGYVKEGGLPNVVSEKMLDNLKEIKRDQRRAPDNSFIDVLISDTERELKGLPILEKGDTLYSNFDVRNMHASCCYSCNEISIWKLGSLLYPDERYEVDPNPDMPEDVKVDFEEARSILNASNRGAAALLRLCIQKLCNHLLGKELDVNPAIAELVKKGLRVEIQQALDSVRVIGNGSCIQAK